MLDEAQVASIRDRLKLTPDQAEYWPAVEAALLDVVRLHAREARKRSSRGGGARIDVNSPEVQQLISAAMPLLMRLREDQKRGIEEPRLIVNGRDEPTRRDGRDRFESALRIAEPGPEPEVEKEVVRARDELALRSATHTRASRQPAPDREVAVAGH